MASFVDLISVGSNLNSITSTWETVQYYDSILNEYYANSNVYINYNFRNSNLLLTDSGPYNKHLRNYGGYYAINSNMNCLYLNSSNYVEFDENNWLLNSNLTLSGWFKTEGFQDGDEILNFTYQNIDHPIISSVNPIQINKNEYYLSFTTTSTNSSNLVTFSKDTVCDILLVGGGGGGGGDIGGGGGAGGVVYQKNITILAGTYNIIVGAGGAARAASVADSRNSVNGNNGNASLILYTNGTNLYTAFGGGGGANYNNNSITTGNSGGCGGGGTNNSSDVSSSGGSASQELTLFNGFTNVSGGYDGSSGQSGTGYIAGGGGGAGGTSGSADGGSGVQINITGSNLWYAAGGGGGVIGGTNGSIKGGRGGSGIGGNGNYILGANTNTNYYYQEAQHDGINNTGSGGGGGAYNYGPTLRLNNGGAGGSGIVIIRYSVNISYISSFFNSSNNLVAWYKFDDNPTNMLLDSSGNGYNLTNNNGATLDQTNYRTGNGSVFLNGSLLQYLHIHTSINPYTIWNNGIGITFACWFRIFTSTPNNSRIFAFGDGTIGSTSANSIIVYKSNTANTLTFESKISNTSVTWTTSSSYIDNNFHHLVLSINNVGLWTVYIDNVSLTTTITNKTIPNATWTKRYIGRSENDAALYTNGNIDDFRIYNKILTASEVNTLYNIGYSIVLKKTNNTLSFELNNTSVYNTAYLDNTWNHFIWNISPISQGFVKLNNSSKTYYNNVKPSINRYPPVALSNTTGTSTSASQILSGLSYGNGIYIIKSSTILSSSGNIKYVFDKTNPTGENCWISASSLYSATTSYYIGTVSTTYNTNLTYLGEWLQIQLPQSIVLTSYNLVGQVNAVTDVANRSPKNFIIVGSIDGINWFLVDTETNITNWTNTGTVKTFNVNSVNSYSYYRICINANQGNIYTTVAISEWELFGYPTNNYYLNILGSSINKGKLYLSDYRVLTNTDITLNIENDMFSFQQPYLYFCRYTFDNQITLLQDSSGNNRTLTNNGGIYSNNEDRNSIYLATQTEVTIPNNNWSSNSDLTISGWFKLNNLKNNDILVNFYSTTQNIIIKNNQNKLSFQINNIPLYESTFILDKWTYISWNILSSTSNLGYVQINDKKTYFTEPTINLSANIYTNKLGSTNNVGNIYISDFKILTTFLNYFIESSMYSSNVYIKNDNMQIYSKQIKNYNVSSSINEYLHYEFKSPSLLTIDSSINAITLNNNGGIYQFDGIRNSIFLQTGNYATINVNENWSIFADLTISGWFKTSGFVNNDKLLEFDCVNTITIQEYPPSSLENATSTSVNYASIRLSPNDLEDYIITSSSVNGTNIRLAFNKTADISNSGWSTQANAYDSNTGAYIFTPAVQTSYQNSTYNGEWIQIKLPYDIVLTSYSLASSYVEGLITVNRSPKDFVILGSTDGITWNLLDNKTNITGWDSSVPLDYKTFNINNPSVFYKYYRICINKNQSGANAQRSAIGEWKLFGYPKNNIKILNNFNKLSFQINNTLVYEPTFTLNNTWTHIIWNIASSSSTNGFVRINNETKVIFSESALVSGIYINKLGSITNTGSLNISDFRIITYPITSVLESELYNITSQYSTHINSEYVIDYIKNINALHYQGSKKMETNASGVSIYGNLTATADIVPSYSDIRLKKIINHIENPLDKLMNIKTFKYVPNSLAKSLGILDDKVRIGLSAQDVNEVLPEIVTLAPFNSSNLESGEIVSKSSSNFLSVSYERVIPLLVESIKELQKELNEYIQEQNK